MIGLITRDSCAFAKTFLIVLCAILGFAWFGTMASIRAHSTGPRAFPMDTADYANFMHSGRVPELVRAFNLGIPGASAGDSTGRATLAGRHDGADDDEC